MMSGFLVAFKLELKNLSLERLLKLNALAHLVVH